MNVSSWIIGILFLWSCFVILSSGVYILFGITVISSLAILGGMICIVFLFKKRVFFVFQKLEEQHSRSPVSLLIPLLVIILDAVVVFQIWQVRTDAPIQTPWTGGTTVYLFVFFAFATIFLCWGALHSYSRWWWLACSAHFFTFYGVALLAFRYGFGYDPLIHQAAEFYISAHGHITPLQPYYIGQYAIVTTLHFLTGIPIIYIDRFFVPLLASLTLPAVIYHGLFRGYCLSQKNSRFFTILFLLIPLTELTFTVPYNLSVLYAVWWIFLLPFFGKSVGYTFTLWSIALATLVTHPLLGMPLVLAALLTYLYQRFVQKTSYFQSMTLRMFGIGIIACSIVILFGVHRLLQGEQFFSAFSPEGVWFFLSLFTPPEFAVSAPIHLQFFYWYEYLIKIGVPLLVFVLLFFKRKLAWIELVGCSIIGGIILSLGVLYTIIQIPGVLIHEQSEFILRLRDTLSWLAFPLLAAWVARFTLAKIHISIFFASIVIAGLLGSVSLYLNYPQVNDVHPQVGWNISKYDIEAVKKIEQDANGTPYAVLSNELFSVIGLREIGFERTHIAIDGKKFHTYAISPEELLSPYATQAFYYNVSQEIFDSLKALTDLSLIYIVVPDSWFRKDAIVEEILTLHGQEIDAPTSLRIYRFSL